MSDLSAPSIASGTTLNVLDEFYDKVFLKNLYPELRMYQLAEKKKLPKKVGRTVTFTKLTKLTAVTSALTEGVPPSPTWASASQQTLTLIQMGQYVPVSDMINMAALDATIEEITNDLGRNAASSVDKYLYRRCFDDASTSENSVDGTQINGATDDTNWSVLYPMSPEGQGFSTAFFSNDGSVVSSAALLVSFLSALSTSAVVDHKLTVKTVQYTVNLLERENVPTFSDGCYAMVIHPDCALNLLRDPEFIAWNAYQNAKETMWKGEVGKINKVRFLTSTNVAKTQGGSLSATTMGQFSAIFNVLLAPGGLVCTEIDGHIKTYRKALGAAGSVDPIDQVQTVGWKWTGVAKVVDNKRGKNVITLMN